MGKGREKTERGEGNGRREGGKGRKVGGGRRGKGGDCLQFLGGIIGPATHSLTRRFRDGQFLKNAHFSYPSSIQP